MLNLENTSGYSSGRSSISFRDLMCSVCPPIASNVMDRSIAMGSMSARDSSGSKRERAREREYESQQTRGQSKDEILSVTDWASAVDGLDVILCFHETPPLLLSESVLIACLGEDVPVVVLDGGTERLHCGTLAWIAVGSGGV
jgi:hypothetical protein